MKAPDIEKNYQIYVYMGCPSNVRLYTSYYNNFIMDAAEQFQKRSLTGFHLGTFVLHITSLILVFTVKDKLKEPLKSTTLMNNDDKIFDVNLMDMQMTNDWIIVVTQLILILRDFGLGVSLFNYMGEASFLGISQGFVVSLLHICSYAFTSYVTFLMLFVFSGRNGFIISLIILMQIFNSETIKHVAERNSNENFKQLLSIVAIGPVASTCVSAVLLVAFQPDKEGLGSILLAYIIVTAAKALHEIGSQTNVKIPLLSRIMGKNKKGEDNGWNDFFAGRRAGHAVLDVAIKGVVGWLIILREIDVSEETDVLAKEAAQGWADAMPIVIYVLTGLALVLAKIVPDDTRKDQEAPSGTMEEKSRMLQVA